MPMIFRGFSLIELLIVIAMISILLLLAVPTQNSFFDKSKAKMMSEQLRLSINFARNEAIVRNVPIILCKSRNQKECSGEWQDGYIILAEKKIIFAFKNTIQNGILHWRSSLNHPYLTFMPSGISVQENGTFWYCLKNTENPAWAIVINKAGRVRISYPDSSGEIIDEKGKLLAC